jgi:HSP20 family protein
MSKRYADLWMWDQARSLMEEAERLQHQFFTPTRSAQRACWEPPADVLESGDELFIIVALPGVAPDDVQITVEEGSVLITGQRPMPRLTARAQIRRLELPHGRFERRLELAPGHYEIVRRDLTDGCLVLGLRKHG